MDKKDVAAALTKNLYRFLQYIIQADYKNSQLSVIPHQELCDTVQDWRFKRKKLILMPRGSFKSSCVTIGYSIQQICANPNIRILIGSEVNSTAKKFLREIKDNFETNERIKYFYGNHVRTQSRWTDDEITSSQRTKNMKEPTVFTTGIDQTRTGMHADIIIIDDPVSHTNIATVEALEKTLYWYREIANNILEPNDGKLIVIGTRWHYNDLYQHILDEEISDFEVVIKSAMTERAFKTLISDMDDDEKLKLIPENELLFPARLGIKELLNKYRSVGSSMFANQYMNKVISDEEADFKVDRLMYYDPSSQEDAVKMRGLTHYIYIDPAISMEKRADRTAIICVGISQDGHWYVLDYDNDRMKPAEIITKTFEMYKRYPHTRKIGIESYIYQKNLTYNFRDRERREGIKLPMVEVQPERKVNKESRIRGVLQPLVDNRRLWIQRGMTEIYEQLQKFPRSKFDDIIDALAGIGSIASFFYGRQGSGKINMLTRAQKDDLRDYEKKPDNRVRSRFTRY